MALNLVDDLIGTFEHESQALKRDQEELKRPKHLRPVYYRVLLTTRPFGLALCKTFEEKYLCVVLPESPSGQLGLVIISMLLYPCTHSQENKFLNICQRSASWFRVIIDKFICTKIRSDQIIK